MEENNSATKDGLFVEEPQVILGLDGLKYCLCCGGLRERVIHLLGEPMKVSCLCRCLAERQAREEEKRKQQEKMDRICKYRSLGFCVHDDEIRNARLENDDGANEEVAAIVKGYLEHFDEMRKHGLGILFYGPVGTGKSFYAGCIFNGVIDQCRPALITNFSRLINETNAILNEKQNRLDRLMHYDLVVIDDLGVERIRDWNNEQITLIVDVLYRSHVPLVITSNYTPRQLCDEKDVNRKRIYDRILKNCRPVPVMGESRRKQLGKTNTDRMKSIIGC